ncbi:DUF4304 domain-containing protein [Pedobacter sp. KR3-3]|uniref:DUF4304 domain-containing protein n=1 Tax=Pedobacter albus TaxID=3113905 RepID=A0ABU7IAD2_9SPHI|nr:DUF4304 domain-containing protein [Pedobacter sp. KR3-3]MEE1946445.1 DUF4304 domain-containing protein [Pedobacter sp. KR3-3]
MEKRDLKKILDELLMPIAFKSKGNNWTFKGNELVKMVNLQKSQYSNSYYVNYGYILRSISFDGTMHIYNRVASKDIVGQQEITELLDLDSPIPDQDRTTRLKEILIEKLIKKIENINSEDDILHELQGRPHLNDIPLIVKEHFNLEL